MAVLPVMLCHAHIAGFRGGFVGVDVFFVISGFLITSILLGDMQRGEFSLWRFYERRCRRILPPLIVVVLASAALSLAVLTPMEVRAFAKSAMWLSFFSSNVGFAREFGYFDAEADTKPLLHTWSLAVEEQFYVLFPILLFLGLRFARGRLPVLLGAFTVASMLLSFHVTRDDPSAAFYLIQYRAWELALGSVLAFWAFPERSFVRFWLPPLSQTVREALALTGALCILVPVVLYSPETAFPGLAALPPCLGAFLIIWTNTSGPTRVGRALSTPVAVGIGLVSYALYLWHWPLLVFSKLHKGEDLSSVEGLLVLAAAALLSFASLRLVERPFRSRALLPARRQILATSLATLLVMGGLGFALWKDEGLVYRIAGEYAVHEAVTVNQGTRLEGSTNLELAEGIEVRTFGGGESSANSILIIGDSLAAHWIAAARDLTEQNGITVHLQVISSCPPLVNTTTRMSERRFKTPCLERNRLYADFVERLDVGHVVLSSAWAAYVGRGLWVNGESPASRGRVARTKKGGKQARLAANTRRYRRRFTRQLDETVRLFVDAGIPVWVMLPGPQFPFRVPERLFRLARAGEPLEDSFLGTEAVLSSRRSIHDLLDGVVSRYAEANFLDPVEILCPDGSCITVDDGYPLY